MKFSKRIYARRKTTGAMLPFHKGMLDFFEFDKNFDIVEVDDSGNIVKVNNKIVKQQEPKEQEPINLNKEVNEKDMLQELMVRKKK